MATTKRCFLLFFLFWASLTNIVTAQLSPMSPIMAEMATLVAKYEKDSNIIMKCESDYLYATTDNFSKSALFAFQKGIAYHIDLFGKEGNLDNYTVSFYNVDEKGHRTTLVPSPISKNKRVIVDFKAGADGYFDIEIKAKPKKATDYYVQYGLLITQEKGDAIDHDESILELVKSGQSYAEDLEGKNIEPVHIEINTVLHASEGEPPSPVEVIRRFNVGRKYYAHVLSGEDVPELGLVVAEKQKGKWVAVKNGEKQERETPGDYVYATVSPDSMAEYLVVVTGKKFKKGEITGRCLIIIASQLLPAEPDKTSTTFRTLRGKRQIFNHFSNYQDDANVGEVEWRNGYLEFSGDMTQILIKHANIKADSFSIITRNYDAESNRYDFLTTYTDDERYNITYFGNEKVLMVVSVGEDTKLTLRYMIDQPVYKQVAGKTFSFNKITDVKTVTLRNERGSLTFNNSLTKASFKNTTLGKSVDMTVLYFYYKENENIKFFDFILKDTEGNKYNYRISSTIGIYDIDKKEFLVNK